MFLEKEGATEKLEPHREEDKELEEYGPATTLEGLIKEEAPLEEEAASLETEAEKAEWGKPVPPGKGAVGPGQKVELPPEWRLPSAKVEPV